MDSVTSKVMCETKYRGLCSISVSLGVLKSRCLFQFCYLVLFMASAIITKQKRAGRNFQNTFKYVQLFTSRSPLSSIVVDVKFTKPVPVVAGSKAWVCGRSAAEIVDLNPTGGIEISLL